MGEQAGGDNQPIRLSGIAELDEWPIDHVFTDVVLPRGHDWGRTLATGAKSPSQHQCLFALASRLTGKSPLFTNCSDLA
jgi:hypothetical protein